MNCLKMRSLTLLPIKLLKFEGSTEYSVSIHSFLGSIPKKLMPKTISTFRTGYLYCCGTLFHSGHWIFSNKMCKCWPRGWMFIFCLAMEKLVTTVWTYIYPFLKVISKFFARKPAAKRHPNFRQSNGSSTDFLPTLQS